ncbi:glutathione S-transferase, putative [Pediculus humanus corporis]|uniref:glutathione transferase n=1 Tax=Pediculus humanus subsp. corporis TaxID=121224 RepID=E0V9D7_PEDHC|nr:glutathione S-transferase, putative [Pediculus humanus corporis]EEB09993.1 glutathione S-transferase, putative [Pediculus humanus corporis]
MTEKYKLIYFNVTGLAEPIRYLFAYGKIPYEDCRLEYEEWLRYKPETPFGQIPVLEINDKPINQSVAICRYLGKRLNLTGSSDWDSFLIDSVVDTITDFRLKEKESKLNEIKNVHNPYYLERLEKIALKNGGYFVNNQLTWADIFFSGLSDLWIKLIKEPILMSYPTLKSLKMKVESEPNIKTYLDKRPETVY